LALLNQVQASEESNKAETQLYNSMGKTYKEKSTGRI